MGMRVQIGFTHSEIKGNDLLELVKTAEANPFIYLHWGFKAEDQESLDSVKGFIKEFHKHRGHDIVYLPFWLVHYFANNDIKACKSLKTAFSYEEFNYNVLSHGIDNNIHGDIEYLYLVSPTQIYCLSPKYKNYEIYDYSLIKSEPLN